MRNQVTYTPMCINIRTLFFIRNSISIRKVVFFKKVLKQFCKWIKDELLNFNPLSAGIIFAIEFLFLL